MSSPNHGLSARSLAETALVVSRMARGLMDESVVPSDASLRLFWQSTRALQQRWAKGLDQWTFAASLDIGYLEQLAPSVFSAEMLVRTWGTILAAIDRRRGTDDLAHFGRHAVSGLQTIRHGILARLLSLPDNVHERVMTVDRLRRRCDRWTDVLVGPIAVVSDCFEFALNAERARDFGEENLSVDPAIGPHPVEHLVSAGFRLTYLQHLPITLVVEPELVSLSESILSSLPDLSFHRDGSLRTLLERRIAIGHQQVEHLSNFRLSMLFGTSDQVAPRR